MIYGEEANTRVLQFVEDSKHHIDSCIDSQGLTVAVGVPFFKEALRRARLDKRIRLRYVSEITESNLGYAKELMEITELRHLDHVKGNFAINESEYLATSVALRESQQLTQIIYSNVRELVEHQQFLFDTLWHRAIPADMRVKQIERNAMDLRKIIDTMYVCQKCAAFFIFADDVQEHKKMTGHQQIRRMPFSASNQITE